MTTLIQKAEVMLFRRRQVLKWMRQREITPLDYAAQYCCTTSTALQFLHSMSRDGLLNAEQRGRFWCFWATGEKPQVHELTEMPQPKCLLERTWR